MFCKIVKGKVKKMKDSVYKRKKGVDGSGGVVCVIFWLGSNLKLVRRMRRRCMRRRSVRRRVENWEEVVEVRNVVMIKKDVWVMD